MKEREGEREVEGRGRWSKQREGGVYERRVGRKDR